MTTPFDFNAYHRAWVEHNDLHDPNLKLKQLKDILGDGYHDPIPRIVCADGYSFSAQASYGTYAFPRDYRAWPYERVEVGFPDDDEGTLTMLAPWAEDIDNPTKTVYPYTPVHVVNDVVNAHGGCVSWPPSPETLIPQ